MSTQLGNAAGNHLIGDIDADLDDDLFGLSGDDWLEGRTANDRLYGGDGADRLEGGTGNDLLNGGNGNDRLDGGLGIDTMTGGTGNDTYYVNVADDVVIEGTGLLSGDDRVYSHAANYTLTANVERLTLQGLEVVNGPGGLPVLLPAAVNGTGNGLDNVLDGNAIGNTLSGLGGNDQLYGNDGNDVLIGGSGNDLLSGGGGNDDLRGGTGTDQMNGGAGVDRLDGGSGNDQMNGGAGNDVYVVDSLQDTIVTGPAAVAGYDTVESSISYIMGGTLWKLALTGNADLTADGNASDNSIFGNVGNNRISGGAGADFINATLGNDILNGGLGHDQLFGGVGQDRFVFSDAGSAHSDQLLDFSHVDDTIVLADRIDGTLNLGIAGLSFDGQGRLAASSYHEGGPVGSDSGIYVTSAGSIYYNPTSGVAGDTVLLATVDAGTVASLDRTDFLSGVQSFVAP